MKYFIHNNRRRAGGLLAVALSCFLLLGCGGGDPASSDDEGIVGTGVRLKGTVSSERRLAENTVEIKSEDGTRTIAAVDSNGRYQSDNIGGEGPYLIRADLGNNNFQYSIGYRDGDQVTQNLHSYTDAATRNWFSIQSADIDSAFSSDGALPALPTEAQYTDTLNTLSAIVGPVQDDYGLSGIALQTADFNADGTGIDDYLINNPVIINNGEITIIINDPNSDVQSVATSNLSLTTDLSNPDLESPATPDSLRVLQASSTEAVIVWQPAVDNIGVAIYQIFRDGALIDTTPYPVYTDSGLSPNTTYSYSIVAVDAAGNESSATIVQMLTLSGEEDNVAPPAPTGLRAQASANTVDLFWLHEDISDVVLFEVQRAEGTAVPRALSSVPSTFFNDSLVQSGTDYCYRVVAIDSSNNRSENSETTCISTLGAAVITQAVDVVPPGGSQIAFAQDSFTVSENSGSVTVNVARTGTAATSVDYTVVSGSASDGQDFQASSGTLTWAAGDTAPQSITVQINSDSLSEGDETFSIMLSNAGGNEVIASSETTVTIVDATSAGCTNEITEVRVVEDTTLSGCYLVQVNIVVQDGANLTISPGSELRFASGTQLRTASGGSTTVNGTAQAPILFTGQEKTPGFWGGVEYSFSNSSRNILNHVTVEYGGSEGENLEINSTSVSPTRISISNSTFRNSSGLGADINDGTLLEEFTNNTLSGNDQPLEIAANVVSDLNADSTFTGNNIDFIEVTGRFFDIPGTWQKQDVPYTMDSLSLRSALTVEAGVRIEFLSNALLGVRDGGSLTVSGTAEEPVVFTGVEKTAGFWQGVSFVFSGSTLNRLEHVTLEYGGTSANSSALLSTASTSVNPTRLALSNVQLQHSLVDGFNIVAGTIVSQFANVTSTSNARPGSLDTEIVGSLGNGLDFTGNDEDTVLVESGTIVMNESWDDHGVPYTVDGTVRIDDTNLTLNPGVELLMQGNSSIDVLSEGSFTIAGSAENPVSITGEEPISGFWRGIDYRFSNSTNNTIDNAIIRHGGLGDARAANIIMNCTTVSPARLVVSNSLITDSGNFGIFTSDESCVLDASNNVVFSNNSGGATN